MKTTPRRGFARRLTAALGVAALAAAGVLAAAVPASAAPGNMPTGNGTLTIHKYEQPSPAGGADNNGTAITVPGAWVALTGVNFTIQRITDVDLNTDAGWNLAKNRAASAIPPSALGSATTVTTGSDGSIASTLAIGAYLVTEVASPNATISGGTTPANITMTAAPFVVTVPVPTGTGTWNTNVHVYPKNSLTAVTKSVAAPSGSGLGSTLTWTIDVKIPYLTAGQSFTGFAVTDTLDAKLTYLAGSATAKIGSTDVALTDSTSGQNVAVSPTDLNVLAANQGETLSVTFRTTVIAAGEIDNQATAVINGTGIGSNQTASYWGQIKIDKHAEGDAAKTLQGAVFTVHETAADAAAGTGAISVGGQTQFPTGADGSVTIPGLWVSNTADATKTYYLREVTAPAGYDVYTGEIAATLTASGAVATPVTVTVADPQKPQLSLPITGGDGARTLMILGGGLLLAALGVAIVALRRRRAAQR